MAKSEQVIGRVAEKRVLDTVLASRDPELVAVYGRRRVGKTFLIREYLKSHVVLEVAGMHDQSTAVQLVNHWSNPERGSKLSNCCDIASTSPPG